MFAFPSFKDREIYFQINKGKAKKSFAGKTHKTQREKKKELKKSGITRGFDV